ncbi:hypothetical protein A2U01_0097435, partial [Trifolium medium]|nr:hypothetical protein [Trifolium medium]
MLNEDLDDSDGEIWNGYSSDKLQVLCFMVGK